MKVLVRGLQLILGLSACLPVAACAAPAVYFAKPTNAIVVDAETRQPIVGAVVVADWVLDAAGGGDRVMEWEVTEVLTDEHGEFFIPGWGPKLRPPFAELNERDPEMTVFKRGYEPKYLSNKVTTHPSQESVRVSEWNGKTIALKPFRGTPKLRLDQLESMHAGPLTSEQPWKAPLLYDEILKEKSFVGPGPFFDHIERLRRGER